MIHYPSDYKKHWAVYLPSIQDTFVAQLNKSFADIRNGRCAPAHSHDGIAKLLEWQRAVLLAKPSV